jgi:hypothetical protein
MNVDLIKCHLLKTGLQTDIKGLNNLRATNQSRLVSVKLQITHLDYSTRLYSRSNAQVRQQSIQTTLGLNCDGGTIRPLIPVTMRV